jgi:ribosomal protein L37E
MKGFLDKTAGEQPGEWEAQCERCGEHIYRYRGTDDQTCPGCGAIYNCSGQRMRDDLHTRPAPFDDDDIANAVYFAIDDEIKSVFDHPEGDSQVGL